MTTSSSAYKEVTGDFDVKVRVKSINPTTSRWAKAGLMVRETLADYSRNLNVVSDPMNVPAPANQGSIGRDLIECNGRLIATNASGSWPGGYGYSSQVHYPNSWLRLQRTQGTNFTAYRSWDGATWMQVAKCSQVYPDKVYMGICTTAHNNEPA